MTKRTSVRANAREIYRKLADKQANAAANPPSPGGFGGQGLTEKVRALYEGSAVPVRQIARLAGVTERTIYKYVEKHDRSELLHIQMIKIAQSHLQALMAEEEAERAMTEPV